MGDWEIDKDGTAFGSRKKEPLLGTAVEDDNDLLQAAYDLETRDLHGGAAPVVVADTGTGYFAAPLQSAYDVGDGVTILGDLSGGGGTITWDPETLTDEELKELLGVMRDRKILPPKPVPEATAEQVVKALLKRPGLAWEVFQGLQLTKQLLGPWVFDHTLHCWVRFGVDGAGKAFIRQQGGKWIYHPEADTYFEDVDLGALKIRVDVYLESWGSLLGR